MSVGLKNPRQQNTNQPKILAKKNPKQATQEQNK